MYSFITEQNNWITATHIPENLNEEVDKESGKQDCKTEWILNRRGLKKNDILLFHHSLTYLY